MSLFTSKPSRSSRSRRGLLVGGVVFVVLLALSSAASLAYHATTRPACGGGYLEKWCTRPLDSVVDNWGMYNRECVSYTAYRVAASGRKMPYGFGDANAWPAAARAAGIAVDATPKVGDVAIKIDRKFGHSMYIESINSDGTLVVSEYNVNGSGGYDQDVVSSRGLQFIHF